MSVAETGSLPVAEPQDSNMLLIPGGTFRMGSAARHAQPVDTSMSHVGFRCITRQNRGP